MNLGQQEKLQSLINASALLTPQERVEWTGLLPLMSDKQLSDLENILSNSQPAPQAQNIPPQSQAPAQAPQLSHIVNLPQAAGITKAAATAPPQPKPVDFPAKLKSILAEKELPAGVPEHELELAEGKKQPPVEKPQPVLKPSPVPAQAAAAKPKAALPPLPAVPKPVPKPAAAPAPQAAAIKEKKSFFARIFSFFKSKKAQPQPAGLPQIQNLPKTLPYVAAANAPAVKSPAQPQPQRPFAAPAQAPVKPFAPAQPQFPQAANSADKVMTLKDIIAKSAEGVKQESLESLQQSLISNKARLHLQESSIAQASNPVRLENLSDLQSLAPSALGGNETDLKKKVKLLSQKFGYHQVIFNLEKSPLYVAYIQAGLEFLSQQPGAADKPASNGVSKEQFESMADLLTQIQSA